MFASSRGGHYSIYTGADLARWSSDGSRIAFLQYRDSAVDLDVVGLDGSGLRATAPGVVGTAPVWSPSGDQIAYSQQDGPAARD